MENKTLYYVTNWDDAADLTSALESMDIPHAVEDPNEGLPLDNGQLAIVFPHLRVRQYDKVRNLFKGDGLPYPD